MKGDSIHDDDLRADEVFSPGEEQRFKKWHIEKMRRTYSFVKEIFEIENEEKEPGFPDVLLIVRGEEAMLLEYKVSDAAGYIKFEKAQPLFYKRHTNLDIYIVAYSVPEKRYHILTADEVIEALINADDNGRSRTIGLRGM